MDEVGLLLTKAKSVRKPKRDRDAFDIALVVSQSEDPERLAREVAILPTDGEGHHRLAGDRQAHRWQTFAQKVSTYLDHDDAKTDELMKQLREFLTAVGARVEHG